MKWEGHVACMGKIRNASKYWFKNLKARDHSVYLHRDGRVIPEWIFRKQGGKV
jgi:hypothetical protein